MKPALPQSQHQTRQNNTRSYRTGHLCKIFNKTLTDGIQPGLERVETFFPSGVYPSNSTLQHNHHHPRMNHWKKHHVIRKKMSEQVQHPSWQKLSENRTSWTGSCCKKIFLISVSSSWLPACRHFIAFQVVSPQPFLTCESSELAGTARVCTQGVPGFPSQSVSPFVLFLPEIVTGEGTWCLDICFKIF